MLTNNRAQKCQKPRLWCCVLGAALVLAGGEIASAAPTETILYSFTGGSDGGNLHGGLFRDSSGNLYGTTVGGSQGGRGVVFKLAPGASSPVALHNFAGYPSDGDSPYAGLIADTSGNLYGTTASGGAQGYGVVFKVAPDGTNYQVLHSFAGGSDGRNPYSGLFRDSSGNLYGTTSSGGVGGCVGGCGTVFKLAPDGTNYQVLHSFDFDTGDGGFPQSSLVADGSGNLYGTTTSGGPGSGGVVFKIAPDGTNYQVLHSFTGAGGDGLAPFGSLLVGSSGNLYGTTPSGGTYGKGVVFKIGPDGATYQVLHSFTDSDGINPYGGLIADSSGNLFGMTYTGGTGGSGACYPGCGTVFKLSPDGSTYTVLYAFAGGNDGLFPFAGLIADSSGDLYGTTATGGGVNTNSGTVFKLTGTGFTTGTPFLAFSGKLDVIFGTTPNTDSFALNSSFTLSSASNGINPVTDPVNLQVGTFTTTIPPGSFKKNPQGFAYKGTINGAARFLCVRDKLRAALSPSDGTLGLPSGLVKAGAPKLAL
jgi:uncharacterized repeat protein (TIGR03803 family)